jgi:ankyrin repeat protein
MRHLMRCLAVLSTAVALVPPAAGAAEPEAEPQLQVPKMTREAAIEYLEARRLSLTGSNLVGPILNGDAATVEALLSAGVDVNDPSDLPKPAMRIAVQPCSMKKLSTEQMLTTIEVLLAHGAAVNEPPGATLTPLVVAAQWCPAPIIRRLVKAGAEIDYKTNLGHSALSMALLMSNYDAAEALLDAGARLSAEAAAKLLENKKDDTRLAELVKRGRSK